METDFRNISGIYKTNTEIVNRAIAGIEPEHWLKQPGDDSNHLLWMLGHVVVHRGLVLKYLGVDWDTSWAPLFARGAERGDADKYPTTEEMQAAWQQVSATLSAALKEASAEVLNKEAPKGPLSFDGKLSGSVAFLALHDSYHTGQISFLRKWLGYGQTVG